MLHSFNKDRISKLAASSFSPTWIENRTPKTGWRAGDGSENYHYNAVAPPMEPEDDGVVPSLVFRAREMGLDV